ncbi:MAG: potassium/proton antiporter, partial [Burkholderiaceae bacterium]|nr:potassium/proton antiporter [Burkholderiaceae bacterium]
VLSSLLLQGATIGTAAKALHQAMPEQTDEEAMRHVFGDFELAAHSPMGPVCNFYGLPSPAAGADGSLGEWMALTLQRPAVAGDSLTLGHAVLSVRKINPDGTIETIGLRLEAPADAT